MKSKGHWIGVIVLLAALSAGAVPATAAAPKRQATFTGRQYGTGITNRYAVSLSTSAGGTQLQTVSVVIRGCFYVKGAAPFPTFTFPSPIGITKGSFSSKQTATIEGYKTVATITGRFLTATHITGTIKYNQSQKGTGCVVGPYRFKAHAAAAKSASVPPPGRVFTVPGIVVHRAPLLGRYAIIGPKGHLVPIDARLRVPPLAHHVVVRLRKLGGTFVQVGFTVGPATRTVVINGVVSYVSARGHRFTVSDMYSSILVIHRLKGPIPTLFHRIALTARFNARGGLVEKRVVDLGFHGDTIRSAGFVKFLILPTSRPVATQSELLPAGACADGCVIVTSDDSGQTGPGELIPIPLPKVQPTSLASAATKKPKNTATPVQALQQAISSNPSSLVSLNTTLTNPPPSPSTPVSVISAGTITITGPITYQPTTPTPPVVVPPPPSCGPFLTPVLTLTGQLACGTTCPPGLYAIAPPGGGFECADSTPVQLPHPPTYNVCADRGSNFFQQYANAFSCVTQGQSGVPSLF